MTINLLQTEIDALNDFKKKLPPKLKGKPIYYEVHPTGIGDVIIVVCGDKKLDITDYSRW